MASFLTANEMESVMQGFRDLHDTFKRTIYVYIKSPAAKSSNSSFNPLFGRPKNAATLPPDTYDKHEISARVLYMEESKDGLGDLSPVQTNILGATPKVRIKVSVADYELVKAADKIQIEEDLFIPAGEAINEGPFNFEFKTVFLKRKN